MIGSKFGRLMVVGVSPKTNGKHKYWTCKCECGNYRDVRTDNLKQGVTNSCGCITNRCEDLTNRTIGNLKVVKFCCKLGKTRYWECVCKCGNTGVIVSEQNIRNKSICSCGCLGDSRVDERGITIKIRRKAELKRKPNKYDLTGEYGVGYTNNGNVFLFDIEDYDKIKNFYWYKDSNGYILGKPIGLEDSNLYKNGVFLHRYVLNVIDPKLRVDHINILRDDGIDNTVDNRKNNLRICEHKENLRNRGRQKNNTSGYKGVYWNKQCNKWNAQIHKDGKHYSLGNFSNIEDAVKARRDKELELFGDFSCLD